MRMLSSRTMALSTTSRVGNPPQYCSNRSVHYHSLVIFSTSAYVEARILYSYGASSISTTPTSGYGRMGRLSPLVSRRGRMSSPLQIVSLGQTPRLSWSSPDYPWLPCIRGPVLKYGIASSTSSVRLTLGVLPLRRACA